MMLDARSAIIDNDFVNSLAESRLTDETFLAALRTVFSDLNLQAVMHPLVWEHELLQKRPRIALMIREQIIRKAEFLDIFQGDPSKKAYYIYLVKELYASLTGDRFPAADEMLLQYWVRRMSLGEVHSIAMCLVCGCGIFLSDDGDAKALKRHIEKRALGSVTVYNRAEFLRKHAAEGERSLDRHDLRSLSHGLN